MDGEAIDNRYVLLACSDGSSIKELGGLGTYDCLAYLTTRSEKRLWGFAFDYDVNMILGGLTTTQLTRLARRNITFFGEFRIEHIPGKMLRITDRGTGSTVTVWDAFSFVRTSFSQWLDNWKLVSPTDLDFIRSMKKQRENFTRSQIKEIRRYCFMELGYLDLGVGELLDRIQAAGFRPSAWHSPASVSAAALRTYRVKEHTKAPRNAVLRAAGNESS